MKEVEAVRTEQDINRIHRLFKKHYSQDMADIWKLGINVALRISDLLSIEYDQIDLPRRELVVTESKTGKVRTVRLNDAALKIVKRRKSAYPTDQYLFQAHSNRGKAANKPLNRSSVARIFKEVGNIVSVKLGTHSMRKTRGYLMHEAGVSLEQICRVLNHANPAVTMAYIGLTKELTLQTYDDFVL